MAIEEKTLRPDYAPSLYRTPPGGSQNKKFNVRRFCIDDPEERTEYEILETEYRRATGKINILEKPIDTYSQKEDKYYVVVRWED